MHGLLLFSWKKTPIGPMKKLLLTLLISVISFAMLGQGSPAENYELAKALEERGDFSGALVKYFDVQEKKSSYKDTPYKMKLLRLAQGEDRDKPLDELFELRERLGQEDEMYMLHLGRIYDQRYEFQKALESWDSYLNSAFRLTQRQREVAEKLIEQTKMKIEAFANPDNYEIHLLEAPVNSEYTELSPTYFKQKEELLFASSRDSPTPDEEVFKIFHAIGEDGNWHDISVVNILGNFERNTANIEAVNEDGKLFMFSPEKGGDLFYSETRNGSWLLPIEFDSKISNTHLESHFFINEHEDRIIFASGREYKKKGLDLYQSFKDVNTGNWTKPRPFAAVINSELDEDSPYLTPDEHTLYFSSDGHGSIGGYDIFKTELDSTTLTWSEPENMGFPINSPDDDIHFKMNNDMQSGYFASNRLHGLGDFDIYFFFEITKVSIEGKIYDRATKQRLSDVDIIFTPSKYEDEKFRTTTDTRGVYKMKIISNEIYRVEIVRDDEVIFTDKFEIHETGDINTLFLKDFTIN